MSVEAWKFEKDLCRCCHSEGAYKSIYSQHLWLDIDVVYSDMLRECYGIELAAVTESLNHTLCTICDACIQRLRDATEFKQQVQECERIFRDLYLRHVGNVPALQVEIKQEVIDPEDNDDVKLNVYCQKREKKEPVTNNIADDGTDDDFEASGLGDDGDFKLDDEEEDIPQVKKKRKYKKNKIASSKVKKKKKLVRPRKNVAPPKDEDIVDTIQGVINVVKRPQSQFRLQEDVDFKQIGDLFKCCRCEKENKSISNLKIHIKNVHLKIPRFTCTDCAKLFFTPASFVKHKLQEHNIDDRYKCNACDNVFNTRVQLRRHINSFHMVGEKYKCTNCDYECFSVEALYKHKFKHKTVKDYHCRYCRKSFLRKATLQLHERIHTGDRRKVCKECGQAFVQKASLNYHMTKYHPEVAF